MTLRLIAKLNPIESSIRSSFSNILGPRSDDAAVCALLDSMRNPARGAAYGKYS